MIEHIKKTTNNATYTAYLAWIAVALFYLYQYILRVAPGAMIDQLTADFHIIAEQFATLGFLDAFAYAIMQIPLGIVVDKIGVRKTVLTSITLCVTGSFLFATAGQFWLVQISRIMTGIGSAAAFMCAIKTIADYFAPGKRGVLMGLTLTLGIIGALLAGRWAIIIVETSNWRQLFYYSGIIGILVGALVYFLVDERTNITQHNKHHITENLKKIIRNRSIIIYSILAIGLYVPLSALADLWGVAFMKQKFGFSQAEGVYLSSMLYVGLGIGSILLPWLTEKFNLLNFGIFICSAGILALFSMLLYSSGLSYNTLIVILLALGILCGAEMMCFTGALVFADRDNSGEVIGVVNTCNMLGGALLKYGIGFFLDATWNGTTQANGLRYYGEEQYTIALSSLTIILIACCLISLLLFRETRK